MPLPSPPPKFGVWVALKLLLWIIFETTLKPKTLGNCAEFFSGISRTGAGARSGRREVPKAGYCGRVRAERGDRAKGFETLEGRLERLLTR
jgi:hypothetical protein